MSLGDAPLAPSRRQRLQRLLVEFGPLGVSVHFAVYGLVLVGMGLWIAHQRGTRGGAVGTWAAAYVATKLILPLRAALTLTITPPLRRWWVRRTHAKKATVHRAAGGLQP